MNKNPAWFRKIEMVQIKSESQREEFDPKKLKIQFAQGQEAEGEQQEQR